jgi:YHS domain-containing protein
MKRSSVIGILALSAALATTMDLRESQARDQTGSREVPAAFASLEYLVGRWNGQGVPKDNRARRFQGWTETHTWAWAFTQGKPAGMTVTIEGGKVLSSGKLTYDAGRKLYRLEGTEPKPSDGKLTFEGTFDKTGKSLILENVQGGKAAKSARALRVSLWPNANFIRYTMAHDLKEAGAVQFTRLIEVGLTRDGESLAGASAVSEGPRCIVTGGAANMTLTYQGRSFPICCTGCRDEFTENPEKYLKKASLMAASKSGAPKMGKPSASGVSRFEDAFADDVTSPAAPQPPGGATKATMKSEAGAPAGPAGPSGSTAKNDDRPAATRAAARASTLLKLGQNLERSGKPEAALRYYRQIVKDFDKTPAAKMATERVKLLDKP